MESFPESIRTYLAATHGPAHSIDLLHGLSGAHVWRVLFADSSTIIKTTEYSNELAFYESIAPTLHAYSIPIPRLEWSARIAQSTWFILEDIPNPFPRSRWHADHEQLNVLRRLHQLPGVSQFAWPELFTPQWTSQMTEQALAWFPTSIVHDIRHRLEYIQVASQHLFTPQCYISGDPNTIGECGTMEHSFCLTGNDSEGARQRLILPFPFRV